MQQNKYLNTEDQRQPSSLAPQNKYIFVNNKKAMIDCYNESARQSKSKSEMTVNFLQTVSTHESTSKQTLSQICPQHQQPYIVTLSSDNKLACNGCMFECDNFDSQFLSMYTKKLYHNYVNLYHQYTDNFDNMGHVQSHKIKSQFKQQTQQVIDQLNLQLNEIEQQLIAKVKTSQALQQIRDKANNFNQYELASCKNFEFEKNKFDRKITDQDYVSIVRKQEFYRKLFQEIQEFTEKQVQHTNFIQDRSQRVLNVKYSNKQTIKDLQDSHMEYLNSLKPNYSEEMPIKTKNDQAVSLQVQVEQKPEEPFRVSRTQQPSIHQSVIQHVQQTQLVQESRVTTSSPSEVIQQVKLVQQDTQPAEIVIDDSINEQIEIDSSRQSSVQVILPSISAKQESPTCCQYVLQSAFRVSQQSVQSFDSVNKRWIKHEGGALSLRKLARLVNVQGYCYLIGGAQSSHGESTSAQMTKLSLNEKGILQMQEKANMFSCRCAFGCAYTPKSRQIVVCGGIIQRGSYMPNCEVYHEETDSWTRLPELNQAVAQSTVSILDDRHVYCLGGSGKYADRANQIEHLELGASKKWTILQVKLPSNLVLAGCLALSSSKLLIFGGKKGNFQESSKDCCLFEAVIKKDDGSQMSSLKHRVHDQFDFSLKLLDQDLSLKAADAFACTGYAIENQLNPQEQEKSKSVLIFGTVYAHKYDMSLMKFTSFMKVPTIDKKDN